MAARVELIHVDRHSLFNPTCSLILGLLARGSMMVMISAPEEDREED